MRTAEGLASACGKRINTKNANKIVSERATTGLAGEYVLTRSASGPKILLLLRAGCVVRRRSLRVWAQPSRSGNRDQRTTGFGPHKRTSGSLLSPDAPVAGDCSFFNRSTIRCIVDDAE